VASIEKRVRNDKTTWTVRWRDGAGQKRKTFAKQAEAKLFKAAVETDMARGTYVDPHAGKVTLESYATQWLAGQTFDASTREATEYRLRTHTLPHLGTRQLQALRPSTIQAWIKLLQATLAPRTVQVIVSNLSSVLNAAVDDGLIARNPCRSGSVRLPKIDKRNVEPWPLTDLAAVTACLPPRYAVMAVLGAGLGLRQGEIFGLAVEDIDFLRGVVHVRRQVKIVNSKMVLAPPKGRKEREVPLPQVVAHALAAHLQSFPATAVSLPWEAPDAPGRAVRLVLSSRESGALNRNYINNKVWKPALVAAGLDAGRDNGMHALRHLYASVLLDGGETIRALAQYLGHSDPGFTLRTYTHLMPTSDQRTKKAVDAALEQIGGSVDGLSRAPAVPMGIAGEA
jgi:integrase